MLDNYRSAFRSDGFHSSFHIYLDMHTGLVIVCISDYASAKMQIKHKTQNEQHHTLNKTSS